MGAPAANDEKDAGSESQAVSRGAEADRAAELTLWTGRLPSAETPLAPWAAFLLHQAEGGCASNFC
jgi:hypothetical protein